MDAKGNKLSSCKIPNQYLKNKKVIKIELLINMDAKGNKLSSCQIPDQYIRKQKKFHLERPLPKKV